MVVKETAYAKINLYLDVVAKRPDGFHDVETVMHAISLADTLTVEALPSQETAVSLTVTGAEGLPTDERNIAVRAARLYLERAGITASVKIELEKRIPVAAGLAGGSTDAAAVLRALDRIYSGKFTYEELLSLAAELGSDVPFCLVGGTAICRGRGERMQSIPFAGGLNLVVAIASGEGVSTPKAYSELDRVYSDFDGSVTRDNAGLLDAMLSSISDADGSACGFYNLFEDAILPVCHGAANLKMRMCELGARCALMSGSGPSVFGICDTEEAARRAERTLLSEGYRAFYATSV